MVCPRRRRRRRRSFSFCCPIIPSAASAPRPQIAKRAGVSDPTVARLVTKLGYANFAEFQADLLAEVEARLHSPLLMMEAKGAAPADDHPARAYIRSASRRLADFSEKVTPAVFDQVEELLMEAPGRVYLLGGRFSRHLAGMLAGYIGQFREGVVDVGAFTAEDLRPSRRHGAAGRADRLRYIGATNRTWCASALRRPSAASGSSSSRIPGCRRLRPRRSTSWSARSKWTPYDTFIPPLAEVEALCAVMVARRKDRAEQRFAELERVREANDVTMRAIPAKDTE